MHKPRMDSQIHCGWAPAKDALYRAYHDEEWGVPEWDDRALFEKLQLDGFQAGLSWITILKKRDNFRKAFDGFEPEKIARYTPKKVERRVQDAGIIRHRGKIEATIGNAKAYLEIMETQGSFADFLWGFVDGTPVQNSFKTMKSVPTETDMSRKLSKELKKRGFKFCGPTIVYAFAEAVGMVNDHTTNCFRHQECTALATR